MAAVSIPSLFSHKPVGGNLLCHCLPGSGGHVIQWACDPVVAFHFLLMDWVKMPGLGKERCQHWERKDAQHWERKGAQHWERKDARALSAYVATLMRECWEVHYLKSVVRSLQSNQQRNRCSIRECILHVPCFVLTLSSLGMICYSEGGAVMFSFGDILSSYWSHFLPCL